MDSEGSSITDAPAILATLYPALLKLARRELEAKGESAAHAEDIVQAATVRWFEVISTEAGAYSHMRSLIRGRVLNLKRPGRDAMDRNPFSLDEITG